MHKYARRFLSALLCLSMLASFLPVGYAMESGDDGTSYFDFEASEYEVNEDAGEIRIKIVRHGDGNDEADVSFKVADFLSDYGMDYVILDEKGDFLEKVYGEKPDVSELSLDGEDDDVISAPSVSAEETDIEAEPAEQSEEFEAVEPEEVTEDEEPIELSETEETAEEIAVDETVEETAALSELEEDVQPEIEGPVNTDKKAKTTGSSLMDAYYSVMGIEEDTDEEKADRIEEALTDFHKYFLSAEGAAGTVHFGRFEREKTITVKIIDNDISEADKIFMIALMGTNSEDTTIAANASTYVTIVDDEPIEDACFDLTESDITLTAANPTAYITVRRNSGHQYFSNVYLSTVKQTAKSSAYKAYEGKQLAFRPGEYEKQVEITAYDFTEDAEFGVVLEGSEGIAIGNYYTSVYISQNADEAKTDSSDKASLSEIVDYTGVSTKSFGFDSMPGGWERVMTANTSNKKNIAGHSNDNIYIQCYDNDKETMYYTKNEQNLIGISSITVNVATKNADNKSNSKYTTSIATDNDKNWNGILDGYSYNGNKGKHTKSFELKNDAESAYIRVAGRCNSGGKDNIRVDVSYMHYGYAKYTFSPQISCANFNRKLYDFTAFDTSKGEIKQYDIFYDGETKRNYNPGGINIKVKNSNKVINAFYPNVPSTLTISAANLEKNEKRGIVLSGVYFAKDNITPNSMYLNGKYTKTNTMWLEANSNNEVDFVPDQEFVKQLKKAGVIDNVHSNKTIKIYPVFKQQNVNVNFENTDRNDKDAKTKGKYDANNLCSHIKNVVESSGNGKLLSKKVYQGLEHYQMNIPLGSVIRVQSEVDSTRIPKGISVWKTDDTSTAIVHYEKDQMRVSPDNANGEKITEDDYTKADIVADKKLTVIKPATGEQNFYVGYSPKSKNTILQMEDPDNPGEKLVKTLANAVTDTTEGYTSDAQATNADGWMNMLNPSIGRNYSFTAYAPKGYYVSWANMTGDTNNDGTINGDDLNTSSRTSRDRSKNPMYVYGTRLNVTLDTDNTRYYYEYVPKASTSVTSKQGSVLRENNTLYRLAKNLKSVSYKPIANAWVDIAGFTAQTNIDGYYKVQLSGLPSWGVISTMITTPADNESGAEPTSYFAEACIEDSTSIILPALETFKAESVSASYENSDYVCDDYITVTDDKLTVTAVVSSNSLLVPKKAKFFIYNKEGMMVNDCTDTSIYNITYSERNGKLTAKLTFNPLKDMKNGYKLYVAFADQNGKWYAPIDVGYSFFAELSLREFVFPLIGSSSLENVVTGGVVLDVIGDPLGDIAIGTIDQFQKLSEKYTPSAAKDTDYEDKYTWQRTTYQFGWDKTFGDSMKTSGETKNDKNKNDEKMKKLVSDINKKEQAGSSPNSKSKYGTKSSFSWSITPSVGFSLTLSQRDPAVEKHTFEDLVFFVKVGFGVSTSNKISLPIGLSVAIDASLNGDVVGVYHMYVDYQDSFEIEDAVDYSSETFGLFQKFNNSVRREGYIFINPKVSIAVGVGVAIAFVKIAANFDFDMDFQFTEIGTNAYGDVDVDLNWKIDVAGFTVYEKKLTGTTLKMFNTAGTNDHIDFDYAKTSAYMSEFIERNMTEEGEFSLTKRAERKQIKNVSDFPDKSANVSLMDIDNSSGTEELSWVNLAMENMQTCFADIDAGNRLMLFINDTVGEKVDGNYVGYDGSTIERNLTNKRAIFYSIYDSSSPNPWSAPMILDEDGTFDDYPNISDLGDYLLISWSSADAGLTDDANVLEVLSSLNIKAKLFDKNNKNFVQKDGKDLVFEVTRTTTADKSADVMPKAAYDKITDTAIIYYTKTDYNAVYDDIYSRTDLSEQEKAQKIFENQYTLGAYRLIENVSDDSIRKLNDECYTDEEAFNYFGGAEQFALDYYGQRFLNPDIGTTNTKQLNVIDSDAIGYNELGLYAWTVDWDGNMNTADDRDVFMQLYDFRRREFIHSIKITDVTGYYAAPKFARSGNSTYLFFGAKDANDDNGQIRYINISDVLKNGMFTKENGANGKNPYYSLYYTINDKGEINVNSDNPIGVYATAAVATVCDSITDYDVNVDNEGRMYLFFTKSNGSTTQVYATMRSGTDDPSSTDDKEYLWGEPVKISKSSNKNYSSIGSSIIGDKIIIVCAQSDDSQCYMLNMYHAPKNDVKVTDVKLTNAHPMPGSYTNVEVTVKNEGLLQSDDMIEVTLDVNGTLYTQKYARYPTIDRDTGMQEDPDEQPVAQIIPGGTEAKLTFNVEVPTDTKDVTFKAYITDDNSKTCTLDFASELYVENEKITPVTDENDEVSYVLEADIKNDGNDASGEITFTAFAGTGTGKKSIGTAKVDAIEPGSGESVSIPLTLSDSDYTIDSANGKGTAAVNLVVSHADKEILNTDIDTYKNFDKNAIDLLGNLTNIKFEDGGEYTVKLNDVLKVQPEFEGVESGKLKVEWQSSSDGSVAFIDYSNVIIPERVGTTTITGIVIPADETIDLTSGTSKTNDWKQLIPENMQRTVTATVNVISDQNGTFSQRTVTFCADNGTQNQTYKVNNGGTISSLPTPSKDGYKFDGWYIGKDYSTPFTSQTKVTSSLVVYAKWIDDSSDSGNNGGSSSGNNGTAASGNNGSNSNAGSSTGGTSIGGFTNPFKDVLENDWFFEYVRYVYLNKLFSGVSENEFAPNDFLTRAMLVTVLWRAAGMPEVEGKLNFVDADAQSYYYKALLWAVKNGIINGVSDSEFAPDNYITRDQIAAIMFRYAKANGYDTSVGENTNILSYIDFDEIPEYAIEAMQYAVGSGLINGKTESTLNPMDNATRAETAAIVQRFFETVKEAE